MWDFGLFLLVVGALAAAAAISLRRLTVFEYQHALLFKRGRFATLLEPGVHWLWRLTTHVEVIDSRPRVLTVPGQEVLSSDGVSLKISMLVQYRINDPRIAQLQFENYTEALYAHAQTVLRTLIGGTPVEKILENRGALSEQLNEQVQTIAATLGLDITSVTIKDIMFPGPLKAAFSQVARARQEGLASLERARGESAALRKLANTAKVLAENPHLYRLRLLQSIDRSSSVILQVGAETDESPTRPDST